MLLVVVHQIIKVIAINKFWRICLSTSLVTCVWFRVDSSEKSWFNLENILTSWHHHIIILSLWADNNSVLIVQVSMTHDENWLMTIVLNKFEVVACLPIVLFLKYINVLKVLFGHLYYSSVVVQVVRSVSHHHVVKNFNLIEVASQIFCELNIAYTIAIDTELDVFL